MGSPCQQQFAEPQGQGPPTDGCRSFTSISLQSNDKVAAMRRRQRAEVPHGDGEPPQCLGPIQLVPKWLVFCFSSGACRPQSHSDFSQGHWFLQPNVHPIAGSCDKHVGCNARGTLERSTCLPRGNFCWRDRAVSVSVADGVEQSAGVAN